MTSQHLLGVVLRASLEGGLPLLALWSITRLWPRMPAAGRRWLWWLGSLRLLVALLPIPRIAIDAPESWRPPALATSAASVASARAEAIGVALQAPIEATRAATASLSWEAVAFALLALWALGAILSLVLVTRRMLELRRQWRAARPFDDPRAKGWRIEWAFALGHTRVPDIRVGAETQVPLAVGVFRPGILLPADAERLSDDALRLVFAHELSHLRRRDPLLGWIPAVAETLFWFHPLARLATREYLAAREELCDADALRVTSASPRDYGELLLDFAVGRHSVVPGAASCGTPAGRHLKRRLHMLSMNTPSFLQRIGAGALVAAFLLIGFVPVRLAALETHGTERLGKRSPMSYMLKIAGSKGTRGSIDIPADMQAARDLDRWNRTAVYFRFNDERWVTFDPQTTADVRRALEAEDRFEAKESSAQKMRDELERDYDQIETRHDALEARKEKLEERKSALEDRWQDLKDQGKSTNGVEAEKEALDREREALDRKFEELTRAREGLAMSRNQIAEAEKISEMEQDRLNRQSLREIERIGRRALERGVAQSYERGGSSTMQVRPSTPQVFISPGTRIW